MKSEYFEILYKSLELANKLFVGSITYNKQFQIGEHIVVLKSLSRGHNDFREYNIKVYDQENLIYNFGLDNYQSTNVALCRYSIQCDGLSYDRFCNDSESVPSGDYISDVKEDDIPIENTEEWFFQNALIYTSVPSYEDYNKSKLLLEKTLQELQATYCYIKISNVIKDHSYIDLIYEHVYQELVDSGYL